MDIEVILQGHPNQTDYCHRQRRHNALPELHGAVHQPLAQKVEQRDSKGPEGDNVDISAVEVVRGVVTNDAGEESPGTKEP